MATDLHERLSNLAAHTPPGSPPADLWDRGVRRRRVVTGGRVAVAVAVVLAFLVGIGGWTWHQSRPVQPADTNGTPHLPDQFFEPSPWLPAFDGPPGQLVAIGTAERRTMFHTTYGDVYGVTASTGRYGFLRLPGLVTTDFADNGPALSPDGSHLAYWVSGPISGRPNLAAVGGVAVYDVTSGATQYFRQPSAHGLRASMMIWVDARTLVVGFGRWAHGSDAGSATDYAGFVWDVSAERPSLLAESVSSSLGGTGLTATRGLVVEPSVIVDPVAGHSTRVVHPGPSTWPASLSPTLHVIVGLHGSGNPSRLVVRRLRGSLAEPSVRLGAAHVVTVGPRVYEMLGWLDDTHVAAVTRAPGADFEQQIDSVDIVTGARARLVKPGWLPTIATDLLAAPRATAHAPPRPWDHRAVAGGVLLMLLIAGLVTWGARRGRRT